MYNDENNLYHYTYTKDTQPGGSTNSYNSYNYSSQPTSPPPVPSKKPKKNRRGLKIAALALSCALLGGAVGGGLAWAMSRPTPQQTTVHVSNRPATEVVIQTVDGKNLMTDAEVYAANVNSVVSINVTGTSGYNFFGQPTMTASSGSGFILTQDGYIATNYHVVEDAETVKVTLFNGDEYDARYIGGDKEYDLAVIKVEASELQPVTLGDSDSLNVGDRVLAIGNPLGELTFSQSGGMVSSVNRAINVGGTPFNMIQTDASINSGNSGGPLFNSYGEVVGIVSAKYTSSRSGTSVEGLGFALPINDVFAVIQDIMTNGHITNKPYLGLNGGTMTKEMAAQYDYDISTGVFVYSVEKGHAAQKAGIRMGDVIRKVDDNTINTMEDLTMVKKQYAAGDTSVLTVYREGSEMEVKLTWDPVPEDEKASTEEAPAKQPSQNPGYNPYDFFEYFFGNPFGY